MSDPKTCESIERLLVFYACDELDAAERARVVEHVKTCTACAGALEREQHLREAVAACEPPAERIDPSGLLLARCRDELNDALDTADSPGFWKRWMAALSPADWFSLHPAWSAALLLLIGIALGQMIPQWLQDRSGAVFPNPAMTVSAFSDQDLRTVDVAGVNLLPGSESEGPRVEVQMSSAKPVVLRGTVDDSEVRRVLMFVVQNNQRFDPGVRLDSVEVLRASNGDTEVRRALCYAARHDRNPGVRLKALESVRGFEHDDAVLQALLDALLHDGNPGVRIEAINALRAMAESAGAGTATDPSLLHVLQDRMQKDPNAYIRLQSAAAIRQLGPHEVY